MTLVDSSGWIEYLGGGPLADEYGRYVTGRGGVLTPTVVVCEVYKKVRNERGEEAALLALSALRRTRVADLTQEVALAAADASLKWSLPLADAVIYATARLHGVALVTSDRHLRGLEEVTFLPLPGRKQ